MIKHQKGNKLKQQKYLGPDSTIGYESLHNDLGHRKFSMDSEEGYETIPADKHPKQTSPPRRPPPSDLYNTVNKRPPANGYAHSMRENPQNSENRRNVGENPRNASLRAAAVDSEYEVVENTFTADQAINKDLSSGRVRGFTCSECS